MHLKFLSKILFPALFCVFNYSFSFAQQPEEIGLGAPGAKITVNKEIKVTGGFVQDLIGTTRVNIQYDYSKMIVDTFSTENAYLDYKRNKMSQKKGEKFTQLWKKRRELSMEPKFEELFNKYGMIVNLSGTNYSNEYNTTLHVEVVEMHPDQYKNEMRYVKFKSSFVRSNDDVVVRFEITGYGPNLEECYAAAGKMLAKLIVNRMKKMDQAKEN